MLNICRLTKASYRKIPRHIAMLALLVNDHEKEAVAKLLKGIANGGFPKLRLLDLGFADLGGRCTSEDIFKKQDLHNLLTSDKCRLKYVTFWRLKLSKDTCDFLYRVAPYSRVMEIYIDPVFQTRDEKLAALKLKLPLLFTLSSASRIKRIGSKSALRKLPPELLRKLVVDFLCDH